MSQQKKPINQNLTIPNALSVVRILIIPFFAWSFLQNKLPLAVGLLVLSGLTDCVDGFIARKLTQGVVALCLAMRFPVIGPVLLVFIVKELVMLCCAIGLLKKKKRPCAAQWYGKVATVMFYASVALIVVMDGFLHVEGLAFQVISYVLLGLTAAMMIYSAVRYFQIFLTILRSNDSRYELSLTDEIRAKTVREKHGGR